jgi:outer membrane usher protein FimD/PapC
VVAAADQPISRSTKTGASKPTVKTSPGAVPPGFENLLEAQETLVDVYFGKRYRLSTRATYTPNTVEFLEPTAVIEKIPGILNPDIVTQALTGELPSNQELRCYYRGQANCGVLTPEVAGVIFNADEFRADVFVNPQYLAVSDSAIPKFLPPSTAGLAFLQNLSYAFAGQGGDIAEQSNLYLLSQLSWKENSVRMQANYSDREFFDIDTLVGQRDFEGRSYELGWFLTDTQDLRFAPETNLLGFRFGTSLDTRADLRQSSGRQIEVFLQSRGEVSIFKDGRLLSTRFYDPGNQVLDTAPLPGGAYEIEIRIRDAGGERIERQFYVKNQRLPPQDMPLYFVELGQVTRPDPDEALPKRLSEYLARGGFNLRLNPGNAIYGGLSTTADDSSAEFGWFGLGRWYEVSLGGALARDGRYGVNTELRFNWLGVWLTGTYRRIWGNDDFDPGELPLLGPEQEQATANVSIPAGLGRINLIGRHIDQPVSDSVQTATFRYERPLSDLGLRNLLVGFEYTQDDGDDFIFAGLRWRLSDGHWSYSVTPGLVRQEDDTGYDNYWRGNASANWDSRQLFASDLRGGFVATHDRDFSTLGANVDWGGRYGRARFQTERVFQDEGDQTLDNGSLATSFVATSGGAAVGGKEQNRAAVIISLEGVVTGDAYFDVLVNGSRRATARPDSKTLLTLNPFQTYRIRLRARGSDFLYFEDREHTVTLYPGNVVNLSWRAESVNILFGRVIDQDGNPVKNALLKGVSGLATTDELGVFQAEIAPSVHRLEVETREATCKVGLPEYRTQQGVGSVGNLRCLLRPKDGESSG